jgi:hypothetical protein
VSGLEFIPLADLGDDAEAICSRLWDVAGVQNEEDADQDAQTALPWHVRAGRKLLGIRASGRP